jgi:hypothetical protein
MKQIALSVLALARRSKPVGANNSQTQDACKNRP